MSLVAPPNTYREPRFGLFHTARDASAVLSSVGTDADAELERLRDNLISRPVQFVAPLAAGSELAVDQSAAKLITPTTRLVFVTQNMYEAYNWFRLQKDNAVVPLHYAGDVGSPIVEAGMPGPMHWIDNVSGPGPALALYELEVAAKFAEGSSTIPLRIGEFWLTVMESAQSGIANDWPWDDEPNLTRTTSESGSTYTLVRGDKRRRFGMTHRLVDEADLRFYKRVIAHDAQGLPMLYDSPESGDAVRHFIAFDDATEWTTTAGTLSDQATGHDPSGSPCLQLDVDDGTPTAVHTISPTSALTDAGPWDFRDVVLRIDIRARVDNAWMADALDSFRMQLDSGSVGNATTWQFGSLWKTEEPAVDEWIRLYLDPSRSEGSPVSDVLGGVDLSAVADFHFVIRPTLATQQIELCNFYLIDKQKTPAVVNLVRSRIRQDSEVPAFRPTYRVDLELLENPA